MKISEGQYLNQNLSLLKKNFPRAYEIYCKENGISSLNPELLLSDNGRLNLRTIGPDKEQIYVHDTSNPGREAEDFLSLVPKASTGVVLILGMGLGYAVLEILRQRENIQYLVVFERNIGFFKLAMEHMDLSDLLSDKRVVISLGPEEEVDSLLQPMVKAMMLEDIHTLKFQSCFKADPYYEILSSQVFSFVNLHNTAGATTLIHGRDFVQNRLNHLTSMHHDRKLEEIAGRFKGFPALVIASGPSLDKNIDQVARAQGRAVLICADSALPNLLENNIIPDFVTSIDYQEVTYEKIANCAPNKAVRQINLICTSWVTEMVPKFFPAQNVFWAFGNNALERWINSVMGGSNHIPGSGTVAHLNFITADILKCSPIVFVGQDLAFSKTKRYSKNVVLNNEEQTQKELNQGSSIMWVKGGVEPEVPTNRQLFGFVRQFEEMIQAVDADVINATEGGALIQGAPNIPLSQVIEQYCRDKRMPDICDLPPGSPQKSPFAAVASLIRDIKKLEDLIKRAGRLYGPAKKEVLKLKPQAKKIRDFSDFPTVVQKKISDFDKCQFKSDNDSLWPLFDEMTMEALRVNEREKRVIERLAGCPEKYYEWLLKSIDRVNKVNKVRLENLQWFKKELAQVQAYYKKEQHCLEAIDKGRAGKKEWAELSALYHETRNYVLLERLIKRMPSDIDLSGEMFLYKGVIALYQRDFEVAEGLFLHALDKDPELSHKIREIRNKAGRYFWKKIKKFKGPAGGALTNIAGSFFLNGLRTDPENREIQKGILEFAQEDFKVVTAGIDGTGNISSNAVKSLLKKWADLIIAAPAAANMSDCLGEELVSGYLVHHSRQLVNDQKLEEALGVVQILKEIQADNPEHYICLADISFSMEDFDSGVNFLSQAVSLDSQYAQYWKNMGDNLQSRGDYHTAILAYEQFFMAQPENVMVLKQIGHCHTKLGNIDAAQESFLQLKNILESRE